ncbi:hypothetical protein ACFWBI_08935 [Streptomyces sp. NPDC059982]|uniref:hypothetical protein n=1 Tax=unclassified Streptomyces TaxID=2593676 RepID=UPI0036BC489A
MSQSRRFHLLRHHDVTGVSGEGIVADGILWPDGTASVRWRGEHPSVVFWDQGQLSVDHVHGHGGHTEIVWDDEPLTHDERQFLTFALDLAADHMAGRGDEFTAEDDAALARLRQLTQE